MSRTISAVLMLTIAVGMVATSVGENFEPSNDPLGGNPPPVAIISGDLIGAVGEPMVFDASGSYDWHVDSGFGADIRVDDDLSGKEQGWPVIALAPDGSIHAAWMDEREGDDDMDIYYARSTDGGASWSANIPANGDVVPPGNKSFGQQGTPSIAVDQQGRIHIVWWDCRGPCTVYYSRSDDGGKSFTENIPVTNLSSANQWPVVAVDSEGNPHVAWFHICNLYYTKSTDGGKTFLDSTIINDKPERGNGRISIAIDEDDEVHIAWMGSRHINDHPGDDLDVFYDSAPKDGEFGEDIAVGDEDTHFAQWSPDISVRDGVVHIVWVDVRYAPDPFSFASEGDIFYSYSNDGQRFSKAIPVNDNSTGGKYIPSIGVDESGRVHVVWVDERDSETSLCDIYYSYSLDLGIFRESVRVNNETGFFLKTVPSMVVSESGTPHVVWMDERNGDRDIYYNRIREIPSLEYEWNFGDDSGSQREAEVTHAYSAPGVYTVTLVVTDSSGAIGSDRLRVIVVDVFSRDSLDDRSSWEIFPNVRLRILGIQIQQRAAASLL